MQIIDVEQNSPEWFQRRLGMVTGSGLGKIYQSTIALKPQIIEALKMQGAEFNPKDTIPNLLPLLNDESKYQLYKASNKKRTTWKILAERLFDPITEEDARERGHRLEQMATERFEKETGKKTSPVGLIISDENKNMGVSPDRVIYNKKKIITEALELKNFEDAHHVEAVVTKKVPDDIMPQVIQYFIVIDTLEKLHLCFHSDRTPHPKLQYFCITVTREEIQPLIDQYKAFELNVLRFMDEIVDEYAF